VSLAVAKKILGYSILIRYTGLHIVSRNNNHQEDIEVVAGTADSIAGDIDIVGSIVEDIDIVDTAGTDTVR
jgi:hypothetical protein